MNRVKTRTETAINLLDKDGSLVSGASIPIERFEEIFEFKRDSQEFNWLIHEIRQALLPKGLWLSGEALSQTHAYAIIPPSENFYVAKLAMARAERDLAGKETLLSNTNTEGFSVLQLARHENTLRVLSLRLSALRKVREQNEKASKRRKEILDEFIEEGD